MITAALPSSFQAPITCRRARVAFATPPLDNVISKGRPAVSLTFHQSSRSQYAGERCDVTLTRLVIDRPP